LQRVSGTGGRRVAPGSPGNRTNRNSEAGKLADPEPRPDKAPFISYMKGALLHCAAERIPVTRDTPTDAFRLGVFQGLPRSGLAEGAKQLA
jgi:hypothetical protein